MSRKYDIHDYIPNEVIANRLEQLSNAVTEGKDAIDREFTMRIPAELDRDADIVLAEAAKRLRAMPDNASFSRGPSGQSAGSDS